MPSLDFFQASKPSSNTLLGFSINRLILLSVVFLFLAAQIAAAVVLFGTRSRLEAFLLTIQSYLLGHDRLYATGLTLLQLVFLSAGAIPLTWLIFPEPLRPVFILSTAILSTLLITFIASNRANFAAASVPSYLRPLEAMRSLESPRRKTLILLAICGLLYLLAFIPVNLLNTDSLQTFHSNSGDEGVIYPILMEMFVPESNFSNQLYRWLIYEDYHYGYPFYVISALTVLPSNLLFNSAFAQHVRFNILLLRIGSSVRSPLRLAQTQDPVPKDIFSRLVFSYGHDNRGSHFEPLFAAFRRP